MSLLKTLLLITVGAFVVGCPTQVPDPPPPPNKPEISAAPPEALGAMAAGTDAAPRPELDEPLRPSVPPLLAPHGRRDAGAAPNDGGALAPSEPDAGTAL